MLETFARFSVYCLPAEPHRWHHPALLHMAPSWVKLMGATGREIRGQEERKVKGFTVLIPTLLQHVWQVAFRTALTTPDSSSLCPHLV